VSKFYAQSPPLRGIRLSLLLSILPVWQSSLGIKAVATSYATRWLAGSAA